MKLQTETLEGRRARLTVEIEAADLQKAMQSAARRLSRQVRIPGFRKGKAPYHILSNYFGEQAILDEAVDELAPKTYREALEESEFEPYGPGNLEDIQIEDGLKLIYSLPLMPTVDLGDYRAVRKDFEAPEVTDELVNDMLKMMQDQRAVLEAKEGPAEDGDQLTIDLFAELVDDEAGDDDDAPDDDENVLYDDAETTIILGDERHEIVPGFQAALAGIAADEERNFELTFPDDDKYTDQVRGKTARFEVLCQDVQARFVPPLNDEFAQQYTEGEIETLLDLRISVRETAEQRMADEAEAAYVEAVLDDIVAQAVLDYPDEMVQDYIDDMMKSFEGNLKRQGMSLKDYLALNQLSEDDIRADFREQAIDRLQHSLVLGEIVNAEQLDVDDDAVDNEVRARSLAFGDNPELQQQIMQVLGSSFEQRREIAMNLMTQRAYQRIAEIGRGEDPPLGPTPEPEVEVEAEPENAADETPTETEASVAAAEADEPVEAAAPAGEDADDAEADNAEEETETD